MLIWSYFIIYLINIRFFFIKMEKNWFWESDHQSLVENEIVNNEVLDIDLTQMTIIQQGNPLPTNQKKNAVLHTHMWLFCYLKQTKIKDGKKIIYLQDCFSYYQGNEIICETHPFWDLRFISKINVFTKYIIMLLKKTDLVFEIKNDKIIIYNWCDYDFKGDFNFDCFINEIKQSHWCKSDFLRLIIFLNYLDLIVKKSK